jgi:hypothetical protein
VGLTHVAVHLRLNRGVFPGATAAAVLPTLTAQLGLVLQAGGRAAAFLVRATAQLRLVWPTSAFLPISFLHSAEDTDTKAYVLSKHVVSAH